MKGSTSSVSPPRRSARMSSNPSIVCFCGTITVMRTSWTDLNPGRRFLGCEKYRANGGCGYFSWFDPPMCERSVNVIPGLLRRIRTMEEEKKAQKKREKAVWATLLLFAAMILVFLILKT